MKIFLDTAHIESIENALKTGLVDGVTTNPSNLSRENPQDAKKLLLSICTLLAPRDVSIEITEIEPEAVYKQAKAIAQLASNAVVKIACHAPYLPVIKRLAEEGVAMNVTLVFTLAQGVCMAKLGAKYISPFVARLDDIGADGIGLIADLRETFDRYEYKTQILAASMRSMKHVHDVMMCGTDVATLPVALFNELVEHPLTDKGMKGFESDWKKLGIIQFP